MGLFRNAAPEPEDDLHVKITGNDVDGYVVEIYEGIHRVYKVRYLRKYKTAGGRKRQEHIDKHPDYKSAVAAGRKQLAETRSERQKAQEEKERRERTRTEKSFRK